MITNDYHRSNIQDRDLLRVGDIVTCWDEGHPEDRWITGLLYSYSDPISEVIVFKVGGILLKLEDEWMTDRFDLYTYPAERLLPALPTRPGSLILASFSASMVTPAPEVPMVLTSAGIWVGVDGEFPRAPVAYPLNTMLDWSFATIEKKSHA